MNCKSTLSWLWVIGWIGFLTVSPVSGQETGFSAGFMLGEPTGMSFHTWASAQTALDAGAAWSFSGKSALHLHVDYLYYDPGLLQVKNEPLYAYYGAGLRLKTEGDGQLGIRFPVGIQYLFDHPKIDLFAEFAPIFDLAPRTTLQLNAGIGIRYFIPVRMVRPQ
ncbi:MAG: hypothetical protein D6675_00400 [Gemmatimonadetes bacterium]|nr:MAG: hypothetical protein D6675_00400 [Gemmatimonadota bacterium]